MRPLEGIKVLEVAMYGFVPSAGAVLGEWGAGRPTTFAYPYGDVAPGPKRALAGRFAGDPPEA